MLTLILPAILAFWISFLLTPVVIQWARSQNLVDNPKTRFHPAHTHTGIIPRAGGLALLLGILIPALIFLTLNKTLLGILIASVLAVIIGLIDDKQDTSPYLRFVANIVIAVIVVGAGVGIPFITSPFGGIIALDTWRISFNFFGIHSILIWADLFAIVWIVFMMNIVGWSAGVDGQMPGFVGITAIILGFLSLRFSAHDLSQTVVTILCFITAGSFLGFLPWNFYPQKIMPGYGGKTLAGLMLAVISILSGGKVGSALLLLAIPVIDAIFIILRRLMTGKSPFRADRSHLHHALLSLGWSKRKIALFYWLLSAILGSITLLLNSQQKLWLFIIVTIVVLFFMTEIATKLASFKND